MTRIKHARTVSRSHLPLSLGHTNSLRQVDKLVTESMTVRRPVTSPPTSSAESVATLVTWLEIVRTDKGAVIGVTDLQDLRSVQAML